MRGTSMDLDDDYGFAAADEAFKDELDHVMTAVETPRKATRTNEFATPSTRRTFPWNKDDRATTDASGLQTPQTPRTIKADDPFTSRLRRSLLTPSRPLNEAHEIATPSSSPQETPTSSRFKNISEDDLVREVLSLLEDAHVRIGATTKRDLSSLLSKHAKAAEGLRRGRDVTRTTIKARDAKITELTYRVSTLEAELEAEKAIVKHLQWKVQAEDQPSP